MEKNRFSNILSATPSTQYNFDNSKVYSTKLRQLLLIKFKKCGEWKEKIWLTS